jgi:hypothetical protein
MNFKLVFEEETCSFEPHLFLIVPFIVIAKNLSVGFNGDFLKNSGEKTQHMDLITIFESYTITISRFFTEVGIFKT